MMKFYQTLYIIESDTRTPTIQIRILRISQLVIALENILHPILSHQFATIEDRNLQNIIVNMGAYSDYTARRSMLQGIGKKIAHDFLHLITIQPHTVVAMLDDQLQFNAFHPGRFFKGSYLLTQLFHSINLYNPEAQLIGLQLVKVEHLVDKPQHSIHTYTDMIQDAMHRIGQSLVGIQHHQRTGNDGERVTKFMRDIGKEFHIHLLGTLLALCFTLFFQKTKMIGTGLQIEPVESIEHESDDTEIEQPCR